MHRLVSLRRIARCSATPLRPSSVHISLPGSNIPYDRRPTIWTQKSRVYASPRATYHISTPVADDTIYALSSAPGRAAITVIRITGPTCLAIYHKLCPDRPPPKARTATLRKLQSPIDPERTLDTGALLLYFPSPNTVTGEDVLELHVHGGPAIVRSVLDAIPQCIGKETGATTIRPAEAGEFTKRAFYSGRVDLTEVEALGEALAAETEQQRRLAVSGAASGLTQRYEEWRSMLLYARGELEALIDFSEDQHFDESPGEFMASVSKQVLDLKKQLELHILNSTRGELLRSGINVALLGAPNAGKSSLLNRIVGREAAIVSAEEGTTRDIVDVSIDIQGWLVRLGDMAGLRAGLAPTISVESEVSPAGNAANSMVGEVEREGIRRARERAMQADLVIVLISLQPTSEGTVELAINEELVAAVRECCNADKAMLIVINKTDLLHAQTAERKLSISRLLSGLIDIFPYVNPNEVFCLSCKDANSSNTDSPNVDETDAGGLQTFLAGLTKKFSSMTTAAAGLSADANATISTAEARSYWTASLSVTHRQSQFLQECLVHLHDFLEISSPDAAAGARIESLPAIEQTRNSRDTTGNGFFDTTDTTLRHDIVDSSGYHVDNHDDLVGELEGESVIRPQASLTSSKIPYSWANDITEASSTNSNEEFDIVTAAEHLRHAADCLAKLTGRGDGTMSGADVEDVLGVVFEK